MPDVYGVVDGVELRSFKYYSIGLKKISKNFKKMLDKAITV